MDFYADLLNKKQTWIPVPLIKEPFRSDDYGIPEMIERVIALSLRLELPVGSFVGEATKKELSLPKTAITLLKSNIKDESVHERQFNLIAKAYPVKNLLMLEAEDIAQAWKEHPDHTLSKAKELETSTFIITQAILRFFGGQALDRVANDISRDELRHLQANWSVCEELELRSSSSLLKLASDTVDWIVYKLTYPSINANFWHRQSKLMVENGEAPEMEALFNWSSQISFFEIDNRHLSFYG